MIFLYFSPSDLHKVQEIANILFDFGNVIIDIDIQGAKDRLLELMAPTDEVEDQVEDVESLIREYEVDEISTQEFVSGLRRNARPEVDDEAIIFAWNSMLLGIPTYRFGMLEALKPHFTTLLLSNTNALHIDWVHRYLREMHNIDRFEKEYFHDHFYSFEIGCRKPDPVYFQHVIEEALITPERSLFIDDIRENIESAKRMGFQTIHLRPGMEVAEVLKMKGLY